MGNACIYTGQEYRLPCNGLARKAACLAATWIGVATVCVVGNAGLDIVAGSSYHRQQYAVAAWLASAKVGLCRVGSWLFVPGQSQELERARDLLADIREERKRFQ